MGRNQVPLWEVLMKPLYTFAFVIVTLSALMLSVPPPRDSVKAQHATSGFSSFGFAGRS